ncbi:MAG: UDP-N-acetylmuramoylalanine--D-glutamate ligase [Candidatus Aminicenantes bacterium RBG_16_63_14]|nr:MAG: UDP-N-acetylmuramoylalanine--D-glutamate ligase [Candidatus Aminicenantes bacterium RBG_16_63_14]
MELRDKNVLIVGFERTGEALCRFLLDRGARVRVTEKKDAAALGDKVRAFAEQGVLFESGGHQPESFLGADLIVPSPGVPPIAEILAAREKGVPVVSEIELAYLFLRGKIVGITGSNGKSTTTALVYNILRDAGFKARLAGNIGTPLVSFVEKSRDDEIYVTEISSFQLEYTERFTPAVAAVLNVSENHIDWHGTFENYFGAKKKLVLRQGPDGVAVLNRDDPLAWNLAGEAASRVYGFSRKRRLARGAFVEDGWVVVRDGEPERVLRASRVPLPGAHNLENVLAAALIGRLLGVPAPTLGRSILAFRGLEHRLEDVLRVGGVRFVNDSKATTVDATLKALASFDRPIVLILGGRGKGGDFSPLRKEVRRRVRSVVLVGEAADKIEAALGGVVPVARVSTYRDVVRTAFEKAARGDVVLLAPACTSWDMFKNFEERGRTYKSEVRRLAAGLRKKGAKA